METQLFNEKTIKRLCSNIKVSPKQKKNADEWIKLLESGSLAKEKANYFKFALYVLRDILGYSIREDLEHEKSNIEFTFKNSTGKIILCIEVKGESKDLFGRQTGYRTGQETPFKQTWDNMGRIDSIKYGICTNYRDFILIDKSKGYSKIHFFNFLTIKNNPDKLKEFIAIFSKESIIDKGFIETLYEKSIIEEREFTKQFYKLFHETRLMLIKEFQDNGATRDESIHFAQIFLNRLMFMFFAEDTGKLKPRLFEDMVLNLLKVESVFSENSHLVYNLIKSMFESLNKGSKRHNIFGFNGGLFQENIPGKIFYKDFQKKTYFNEIYQHSTLKKEIELDEHAKAIIDVHDENVNPITINLLYMASFDFNTEVSVNILGHIFEQSISDLEELKEEKVLRRKKEGVYYTPDFITDYICRNTIIPYLSKTGVNSIEKLIDEYANDIDVLENRFKRLKILDPACGSGSFLLKAVDILLEIYKQIQIIKEVEGQYTAKKTMGLTRKQKKALRDNLQLSFLKWHEEDEAREIIENNIFGVDINEESVEITKLSLFLKIARKNKKLIDLSNNIKCGNSLIFEQKIALDKAFSWEKEFPVIFLGGGFDIVIGNPPYLSGINMQKTIPEQRLWLKKHYKFLKEKWDLYLAFIEKGLSVLKQNGLISYIVPDAFLTEKYAELMRDFIIKNKNIVQIDYFPYTFIFEDASVKNIVFKFENSNEKSPVKRVKHKGLKGEIEVKWEKDINKAFNYFEDYIEIDEDNCYRVGDIFYVSKGIVFNSDEKKFKGEFKKKDLISEKQTEIHSRKLIEGEDVFRFNIANYRFVEWNTERVLKKVSRPTFPELHQKDKLVTNKIGDLQVAYDDIGFVCDQTVRILIKWNQLKGIENKSISSSVNKYTTHSRDELENISKLFDYKFILACLNSKLLLHLLNKYRGPGSIDLNPMKLRQLPILKVSLKKQKEFIKNVEILLNLNKQFNEKINRFFNRLKQNFTISKINTRLQNFYIFDYKEFLQELYKQKIQLKLIQQDEWEDYFNKYKQELTELKYRINETDNEINDMIYKLYGITEDEKKIIEGSLND